MKKVENEDKYYEAPVMEEKQKKDDIEVLD